MYHMAYDCELCVGNLKDQNLTFEYLFRHKSVGYQPTRNMRRYQEKGTNHFVDMEYRPVRSSVRNLESNETFSSFLAQKLIGL